MKFPPEFSQTSTTAGAESPMTGQAGKLNSFDRFSELMTKLPYLSRVESGQRKKLLEELYRAAQEKDSMRAWAERQREDVGPLREGRRRLSRASSLLRHALQDVRSARKTYGDLLNDIEDTYSDEWGFKLEEIEQNLRTTIDFVNGHEALNAALIHPKLRTSHERQLARKPTTAIGEITDEANDHVDYALGEKLIALDHWLIGEAVDILKKFHTTKKKKIQRYDTIISKMFEAAFNEFGHSEDSIRIELRRKKGRFL
jgi:hypothetical protein